MKIRLCYGCMEQLQRREKICGHCGYDNSYIHNNEDLLPEGVILYGRYLIGRKLGRGGFGVTYLGYDLDLNITAAVKEYFPGGFCIRSTGSKDVRVISDDDKDRNRFLWGRDAFQREAETLALFSSPSIVHVRDYFIENNTAYIVMDYVDGIGLKEELEQHGRSPWRRVLSLFLPLIREMEQLHEKNVIHRDIKPENIKLVRNPETGEERLVLLDFGAARSYSSQNLTQTNTQILTPGYAPYEQYLEKTHLGPFTDIYSLCATMYTMITGERPPAAPDLMMGRSDLISFRSLGLNVPDPVERAIRHGMSKMYSDRPQSLRELYDELNEILTTGLGNMPEDHYQYVQQLMDRRTVEDHQKSVRILDMYPTDPAAAQMKDICLQDLASQTLINDSTYVLPGKTEKAGQPKAPEQPGGGDVPAGPGKKPRGFRSWWILLIAGFGVFLIILQLNNVTNVNTRASGL